MKRHTDSKLIFSFLVTILVVLLSACSLNLNFQAYEDKSLTIGVVGAPPEINEKQVSFEEISFDDVLENDLDAYDAVFIMPENLSHASDKQYANIYSSSPIPFFFIGANNHIPFTESDLDFEDDSWEDWKWTPGTSYASGFYYDTTTDSSSGWAFGLFNDKKTKKNVKYVYTSIFEVIADLSIDEN